MATTIDPPPPPSPPPAGLPDGTGWQQQPWPPTIPVERHRNRAGWIIGGAVGGIIVLGLIILAAMSMVNFTVTGTWTQPGDCDYTARQVSVYNTTGVLLAIGSTTSTEPTYGQQCIYGIYVSGVSAHESGYIVKMGGVFSEQLNKDQASHLNLVPMSSIH